MTPTLRKLLSILADGEHHTVESIRKALDCDNVRIHVCALRKLLNDASIMYAGGGYRLVGHLYTVRN